jgi:hypothetical protein
MARLPRVSPLPCVHCYRTRRIGEGERDGRLGLALDPVCKEREENRREEGEKKSLTEIHLKFEKFKIGSRWWW